MTTKEAINILINEAAKNIRGQGCGIREEITIKRAQKIQAAIEKVYKSFFKREMYESEKFNLGFWG